MTTHLGLRARWRQIAVGGAALSALLYVLMGVVASIALGFSLVMGAIFAVVAGVLFRVDDRRVLLLVAVLDVVAIVGYFAVAGARETPFEAWGLSIKAAQLVLLGALGALLAYDSA